MRSYCMSNGCSVTFDFVEPKICPECKSPFRVSVATALTIAGAKAVEPVKAKAISGDELKEFLNRTKKAKVKAGRRRDEEEEEDDYDKANDDDNENFDEDEDPQPEHYKKARKGDLGLSITSEAGQIVGREQIGGMVGTGPKYTPLPPTPAAKRKTKTQIEKSKKAIEAKLKAEFAEQRARERAAQ